MKPLTRKLHGMKYTPTYSCWDAMKARCRNPKNIGFKDYGGRGINYDDRWADFNNFFADMGQKPDGMTLDRKDVNGPYCKDNCRWATSEEQANNTRNNIRITIDGVTKTMSQWCRINGIKPITAWMRMDRGWDHVKSVTMPVPIKPSIPMP